VVCLCAHRLLTDCIYCSATCNVILCSVTSQYQERSQLYDSCRAWPTSVFSFPFPLSSVVEGPTICPVWCVNLLGHSATSLREININIYFRAVVFQNYLSADVHSGGFQVLGSALVWFVFLLCRHSTAESLVFVRSIYSIGDRDCHRCVVFMICISNHLCPAVSTGDLFRFCLLSVVNVVNK
jgi:hypothetical protein